MIFSIVGLSARALARVVLILPFSIKAQQRFASRDADEQFLLRVGDCAFYVSSEEGFKIGIIS